MVIDGEGNDDAAANNDKDNGGRAERGIPVVSGATPGITVAGGAAGVVPTATGIPAVVPTATGISAAVPPAVFIRMSPRLSFVFLSPFLLLRSRSNLGLDLVLI